MAVTEGTRLEASISIRIGTLQRSSTGRIAMETRSLATCRQRQMLAWMRSFGELQCIGTESTGSYGAGLLEVTTPDKQERRRRGKNDDLDAQKRRPFRGCRQPDRDAAQPRRDDRTPADSHGLPEDRGEQARRL